MTWLATHRPWLDGAVEAVRTRASWSPFQESPSGRLHPEGARKAGQRAFEARLAAPFPLALPGITGEVGGEVSPYTQQPLGITYPRVDADALLHAVTEAWEPWRRTPVEQRVGICLEMLHRLHQQAFENAFATMHTTGQGFITAFAGSGANALDRGLEGLAQAWLAMQAVPAEATYSRAFGRGEPVTLHKRYRLVPVGITVVISCGSYPSWNAYPALFASLATGNPVVIKPHPDTILPMAMAVKTCREVLADAGLPRDLVTLAADTWDDPITKQLLEHPSVAIVDFTGGQRFGDWIEENIRHAQVYTETSGCNAVILESTHDLSATLSALATGLCLFSAQMCTAAQNIFIPRDGVQTPDGLIPYNDVVTGLIDAIDHITGDPEHAAGLCGCLQTPRILHTLASTAEAAAAEGRVLRLSAPYAHPHFPGARTATPLVMEVPPSSHLYRQEVFGPASFVIPCASRAEALTRATEDAAEHGSISNYVYSTDTAWLDEVEDAFAAAGASVGINLHRQAPINFSAAYSDFHVTGLNPAGNACLTDAAFVARRFRIVQSKRETSAT